MKDEQSKFSAKIFVWIRKLMQTRFSEQLAVLLLTTGVTLVCSSWARMTSTLLSTLVVAFFSLLLVWLFTRRFWLLPAAAVAAVVCFGVIKLLRLTAGANAFFTTLDSQFFQFWSHNLSLHCVIFAIPAALLLFVMVRRLLSLSLLGVFCAALIVVQSVFGFDNKITVLSLLVAGYLILLPAAQYRQMNKTTGKQNISLSALQLTAVPIVVVSLACALLLIPTDTDTWKSKTLLNIVYDCNDFIGYYFGSPIRNDAFKIAGLGYQPLNDRLGGTIHPGTKHLLTVKSDRAMLLRGAVQDTYDGSMWYDGWRGGRFRYDSLLWRPSRNQVFLSDLPLWKNPAFQTLYDEMIYPAEATVKYENGWTKGIFVAGKLNKLATSKNIETYFNLQSELYSNNTISNFSTYSFTADLFDRNAPNFTENMLTLLQKAEKYQDSRWENVCLQNLQLPATLPDSVQKTTLAITDGIDSPYLKAVALEQWLAKNCTYTLSPDDPPKGQDFVAHFLQTREGYCVYYATAMAIMARCAGLPSRYVTGFAMESSIRKGSYSVTEQTAHAWAEIYFKGVGWITFDPLFYGNGLETAEANPQNSGLLDAQQPYIPTSSAPEGSIEVTAQEINKQYNRSLIVLVVLIILAVALRVLFLYLMGSVKRLYRYENIARRVAGTGAQLDCYFEDILKQLLVFDLTMYGGETLLEFAPRVDRRLAFEQTGMRKSAEVFMNWEYGLQPPSRSDIKDIALLHDLLEQRVILKLGKAAYFFKRVLTVCKKAVRL